MQILVVTPTFLPIIGGAELGIYEIYQRLGKRYNVLILTPNLSSNSISRHGVKDDKAYLDTNFEVCRFNDTLSLTKIRGQTLLRGLIPPFSISYIPAIFKHIKNFQPDVINFHYAIPGGLALMIVRRLTKIPVVLSLVGRKDVLENETPFFRKHYIWRVVNSASCVIPNSRYYLRWPPGCNLGYVIPYGVDTKKFYPKVNGNKVKEILGIDSNQKVLFTLQRLAPVKNIELLIRSLKHILEVKKDVVLVVGGKGPEERSLKALAKKLDLNDKVIFVGYIPQHVLPKYFAMSDVFVFSSSSETFGIVLVQAMASGKPIVSVNSTSIPEVVDDSVNGTLVEPDAKKFAKAVIDLLSDKNLLKKYSKNGRKKAVEKYDWETISQQYEQVFKDLVYRKK